MSLQFYKFKIRKSSEKRLKSGFTLIEILVSVGIFSFILLMVMGAILSVLDANAKSRSIQTVMDNLSLSLESMTRTIRFSTNYHCDVSYGSISSAQDCASGANSMAVLGPDGITTIFALRNSRISRSKDGGLTYYDLTNSDVTITNLTFWVTGAPPFSSGNNVYQPKVIIVISGYVGTKINTTSNFTLETMVSQRMFDSQ